MSKKMWNKIFKNKPLKTQSAAAKSTSIDNNRYSYYEEFYSTCTVPSSKVSVAPATGKSKFSFANSFSLKRNSKENNSRKSNSNSKSKSNAKTLNNSDDLSTTRNVSPTRIIDTIDNLEPIKAVIDSKNLTIPEAPEKLDLHPCRICNRTFVQKTLSKHVIICEKAAIKKRRQFDSLRQRTEGTELADYLPKKFGMPITKVPGHERSISPNPRALVTVEKSEPEELSIKEPEYVSAPAVEEIKEAVSRKVVHAPPGKSTTNVRQKPTAPHREPLRKRIQQPESNQCPHCQRFFGVKAYERHYIWCKEKSLNIANKNTGISQAAKDRLDARNNYRVPNLKTKRAVNREKYSGTNDEDETLSNSKVMCTSLGSSFMSDGLQTQMKARKKSPKKSRKISANANVALPQLKAIHKIVNKDEDLDVGLNSARHLKLLKNTKKFKATKNKKNLNENSINNKYKEQNTDNLLELCISKIQSRDDRSDEESISNRTETFVTTSLSDRQLEDIFEREFTASKCNLDSVLRPIKSPKIVKSKRTKYVEEGRSDNTSHSSFKSKSSEDTYFSGIDVELHSSRAPFCLSTDDEQKSRRHMDYYDCPDDNISISSSTFSEQSYSLRGLSDKYDPFQSAKRQLEELCSPTSSYQQQKFVHTPLTKSLPRSRLSPGKTITSYSSFNPPLTNPKAALNTIKSNFRRTSSLRSPRKASFLSSRPVYQPSNVRPTVQRGLSDEGPISSNFLRPEEYDEMPVRSVCSNDFAITNSPRVLRRDSSASNRRNLNLNLTKENTISPTQNTQVLKTDSLAIFLKYENEAKTIESPVTAKDLKDKSNTLSKQNSAKSIVGDIQEKLTGDETDKITNMPTPLSQPKRNDTCMTINKVHSIRLDPLPKQLMINNHSTPKHSPQLKQMADVFADSTLSSSINLNSILDTKNISDDFIDPQLINDIDNLPINVTKLSSDSDLTSNISSDIGHRKFSISDTESQYNDSQCQIQEYEQLKQQQQQKHIHHHHQQQQQQQNVQHHQQEQEKPQTQQNDEFQYKPLADSNRNSADSRILLKRKMRVGRNQFLYDASPDSDLDNRSFDSNDEPQNNNTSTKFNMNVKSQINPPNIPPFDEFDFEEFLTSFENDSDQFPLFKDCREFLMNRSFSKQSSSSNKSNKTNKESSSCSSDSSNNNKNIDKNLIHNNISDNYGMLFDRSSPKQICEKKQSHIDEDKRHEIFISIETDHDNDDSINSSHGNSNSLPGKSSAFVEEIDANDNKFTKIIDDGTTGDYNINPKNSNKFPDVKRNNAKNLMMHDYHSTNSKHESDNKIHLNKHSSIGNVAKRGSDSDNGSVSRQSSESQLPSIVKKRPSTATTPENLRYQQSFVKYPPSHEQNRSIGHSASSSSSENSLPPINSLASMDILMKSLKVSAYNETKKTDTNSSSSVSTTSTKTVTPKQIKKLKKDNTLLAMQSSSNTSNSNSRLSKFCHECGSKFLLETAKFCMECGVKRMNV